jgi:protein-disulfide isomerase
MNTSTFDSGNPSDEELLAGVRRRMTAVESLVPPVGVWDGAASRPGAARTGSGMRVGVRSRAGFGGLVPLVLVAVLVVVAVGFGMGSKAGGSGGTDAYTTLTYRLVPVSGQPLVKTDWDATVSILQQRLEFDGVVGVGFAWGGDTISIKVPTGGDVAEVRKVVAAIGHVEFVLLPPAQYGTANAAGIKPVPAKGDTIDPALSAQFTGADLDPAKIQAVVDTTSSSGLWMVKFGFTAADASQFETWTGAHVGEFLAIAVDGVVQTVPSIASAVTGGSGEIEAEYTQSEATQLAAILKAGQLPYPLALVEDTNTAEPSNSQASPSGVSSVAIVPSDIPSAGRTLGVATAPVTLAVWVDFRCSACKAFTNGTQAQLIETYVRQGTLKIEYHDFIVIDAADGGTDSLNAAAAARIAAAQGKFWAYVDLLWVNQDPNEAQGAFSRERLIDMARSAGLDVAAFTADFDGGKYQAQVRDESAAAAGINATPAVLLDGKVIGADSVPDYQTLADAIDAILAAASPAAVASPTAESSPTAVQSPPAESSPTAVQSPPAVQWPPAAASPTAVQSPPAEPSPTAVQSPPAAPSPTAG